LFFPPFIAKRHCYANGMTGSGESSAERLMAASGMQRVPSSRLELFVLRRFLSEDKCGELCQLITQDRRPSTIADANGDGYFRTSQTCDLDPANPHVQTLAAKLATLSGIDPAYAEPMQGQHYAPGQEFKAHTDYFEPDGPDYARYCSIAGQRTWTFMIYLNTVDAGGATRFKLIDKLVQPEMGKLLAWNNRLPDGRVNSATLHHGMKVRQGEKFVITQWYRERTWG
jgi:prolyl 4-hydroxylase